MDTAKIIQVANILEQNDNWKLCAFWMEMPREDVNRIGSASNFLKWIDDAPSYKKLVDSLKRLGMTNVTSILGDGDSNNNNL
jgi:hypothetical protein